MKIFYLQGDYPFCYYYRGYLPGVYSNQTVVSEFLRPDLDISNERFVEKALQADVVCFQRPSSQPSYKLALLLKEKGKKIIFDNDDSYSGIPMARLGSEKQVEIAQQLNRNLNNFVRIADGVTTSTEFLAKEYAQLNPNVAVLKNCIDPLDEMSCRPNFTPYFRIGIIGSVSSNDDYVHIKEDLKKLDATGKFMFVIMGVKYQDGTLMPSMKEDYDFWATLKHTEWHPTVHVTEYMMTLANLALDLIIIPRKEWDFNRAKSNLKFLEASLLKIPVVAQGFTTGDSPYQGVDESYMTVLVDNGKKDVWYNKVIEVMEKHSTYQLLALKAHDYVLDNYNIAKYAPEWERKIGLLINK
jgi:hypothetical protein